MKKFLTALFLMSLITVLTCSVCLAENFALTEGNIIDLSVAPNSKGEYVLLFTYNDTIALTATVKEYIGDEQVGDVRELTVVKSEATVNNNTATFSLTDSNITSFKVEVKGGGVYYGVKKIVIKRNFSSVELISTDYGVYIECPDAAHIDKLSYSLIDSTENGTIGDLDIENNLFGFGITNCHGESLILGKEYTLTLTGKEDGQIAVEYTTTYIHKLPRPK